MEKEDLFTDFGLFSLLFLRCGGAVPVFAGAVHFHVLDKVSAMEAKRGALMVPQSNHHQQCDHRPKPS